MAHVLVIDDEAALRRALRAVLERDGHTVFEAPNGNGAVALVQDHAIDLVVTDLIMPETEGLETIRTLRAARPDLRIIAISGGGSQLAMSFLPAAAAFGADATLSKPFPLAELAATVRQLLGA